MNRPNRLECPLYTVKQIRKMGTDLFKTHDSFSVMQAAAKVLFGIIITDHLTPQQTVHIILGSGNNAGDGLLAGVLLKQYGFHVCCYKVFDAEFYGDAQNAYDLACTKKIDIQPFNSFRTQANDIIIESIFGIGFDRHAEGNAKTAINHINKCKKNDQTLTVYAVDIPAGIIADTGECIGASVTADKTVTFVGDKIGLHTAYGKEMAGHVTADTLGSNSPVTTHCRYKYIKTVLSANQNTHKGDYGHALIIGGGLGMFGAAALASVSSLKVGTGKASIYSHSDYATQFHLDGTPLYEVMRKSDLNDISLYSTIILGIGLGRDNWGKTVFDSTLAAINDRQPLLIDADGLWHLAAHTSPVNLSIITPHEAEASRLLDSPIERIRENKPKAVRELAKKYQCIAVLKGAGTLISDGKSVWINESGNMCLATAGTGDVLAGMISDYLAQCFEPLDAALYGAYQHGLCADKYLTERGSKTLRASDLWNYL